MRSFQLHLSNIERLNGIVGPEIAGSARGKLMFPFRQIVFPVDYSAPCLAVVPYVEDMLSRFSANLTVVHAYGQDGLEPCPGRMTDPNWADKARAHEERRLQEFALKTFPGQHVEYFAELGEAGCLIHKTIQQQGADVVMLAAHGGGPARGFLLGSVAAKVLDDPSAAVWTGAGSVLMVRHRELPYKSVLCALEEGDEAERVLKVAAAFACVYQAQLWIVQVVKAPPATLEVDFDACERDLIDAADFRVCELKGRLGISTPHAVVDGAIEDGVHDEAIRRTADLVITGHRRSQPAFGRIWSHVYPIIRKSPCPVLSV
jgi:nucleotide-binding universal stress UspA family protein